MVASLLGEVGWGMGFKLQSPAFLSQALLLTNLSGYSKVKDSKNFVLKSPLLKRSSFISCR